MVIFHIIYLVTQLIGIDVYLDEFMGLHDFKIFFSEFVI